MNAPTCSLALALTACLFAAPTLLAKDGDPVAQKAATNDALLKKVSQAMDAYYDSKITAESKQEAFVVKSGWNAAAKKAGFKDYADMNAQVAKARKSGGAAFAKKYKKMQKTAKARYEKLRTAAAAAAK